MPSPRLAPHGRLTPVSDTYDDEPDTDAPAPVSRRVRSGRVRREGVVVSMGSVVSPSIGSSVTRVMMP